ncbi:hypothetical protein BDA96_01G215200 [Sorghum bicolor]|uniref:Uncharacterized protein n=2 Tax=Sorghum bicolor TaxID=4558 RepID=A0A921UYW5_SORBI|nr:hypothetical protein BDA96_01G215200 [Sorghum bicolor]OQU91542.1 hypothetical protein SORBI_3001G201933 [Sorghum bicolor]
MASASPPWLRHCGPPHKLCQKRRALPAPSYNWPASGGQTDQTILRAIEFRKEPLGKSRTSCCCDNVSEYTTKGLPVFCSD